MGKQLSPEVQELIRRKPHLREMLERNPPPLKSKPPLVVEVARRDPNWTEANGGRVRVQRPDGYEPTEEEIRRADERLRRYQDRVILGVGRLSGDELAYQREAERRFAGRRPVLVVSNYDPIKRFEAEFDE